MVMNNQKQQANVELEKLVHQFRAQYNVAFAKVKQDSFLFSIFCARYYFFNGPEIEFDAEQFVADSFVDGANDGGIDSIFLDPIEENGVVVIQAKYYLDSSFQLGDFKNELYKTRETIKNLRAGQLKGMSAKLTAAYSSAAEGLGEDPSTRVIFCIADDVKDKKRDLFVELCTLNSTEDMKFEVKFLGDIIQQVRDCEDESPYAVSGILKIDEAGNVLWYRNGNKKAAIVNITGKSLQDLFNLHGRQALGMNLRYHVDGNKQNKEVDNGMRQTLEKEPDLFWFRNNGILIVCEDFSIKGDELSFKNFSIVNGGQTSYVLSRGNMSSKCYLQCKIAAVVKDTKKGRDEFVDSIARATNSQKPIKPSDLKANAKEQLALKDQLAELGLCYMLKGGDRSNPRKLPKVNLDELGNIAVSSVLICPGSVRSVGTRMFYDNPANYKYIFEDYANAEYLADMYFATKVYKEFKKDVTDAGADGVYDLELSLPMVANGVRHYIGCLAFLSKLRQDVFTVANYNTVKGDDEATRDLFRQMKGVARVFKADVSVAERNEKLREIYDVLTTEVFTFCSEVASQSAEGQLGKKKFIPANYLKGDKSFFMFIVSRLIKVYGDKKSNLKKLVDEIMI